MGMYSLEVPSTWIRERSNWIDDRPYSLVNFSGPDLYRPNKIPVGVDVEIRKTYRLRKDHPGSDSEYLQHKEELRSLDKLFDALQPSPVSVGGLPTVIRQTEDRVFISPTSVPQAYPLKVVEYIARSTDAYYSLRYSSPAELFDRNLRVFERMRGSFKLVPEREAEVDRTKSRGLILDIAVPRNRWRAGENLWYRLAAKNKSKRPIYLDDDFWWDQKALARQSYRKSLRIEITDVDGKIVNPNFLLAWGFHGEFDFWANECPGTRPCDDRESVAVEIMPGEEFVATPTVVAPIRKQDPYSAGLTDARSGCKSLQDDRRAIDELADINGKFKSELGLPPGPTDVCGKMTPLYPGLRMLEGFKLPAGKYRMRAVIDSFWPPHDSGPRNYVKAHNRDKALLAFSPWIEFEVTD